MQKMRRVVVSVALAAGLMVAGAGCSKPDGKASCDDFKSASGSDQESAIRSMLSAHNDKSGTMLAMASVKAYCALNPGGHIDDVYHG